MTRVLLLLALATLLASGCGSSQTGEEASAAPGEAPASPAPEEAPASPASEEEPTAAPEDDARVRWELTAEPTELTMAERDRFVVTISATNEGSEPVDPQLHRGDFRVGGRSHPGLNLWFGNGVRAAAWSALPPGETATDRRTPGEQLFEAPGEYVLSYAHGSEVTSVTVTVTE